MDNLEAILTLSGTVLTIIAGFISSWIAYRRGKAQRNVEVENLKSQNKSLEAATGLNAAEAAAVIVNTATSMLDPLIRSQKELQEEISRLKQENIFLRERVVALETQLSMMDIHNE